MIFFSSIIFFYTRWKGFGAHCVWVVFIFLLIFMLHLTTFTYKTHTFLCSVMALAKRKKFGKWVFEKTIRSLQKVSFAKRSSFISKVDKIWSLLKDLFCHLSIRIVSKFELWLYSFLFILKICCRAKCLLIKVSWGWKSWSLRCKNVWKLCCVGGIMNKLLRLKIIVNCERKITANREKEVKS